MKEKRQDFDDEFSMLRLDAFRTAFGILGDAQLSDDAASEALAQVWLHWPAIAGVDYRTAWVRRVTINAALRILRKRGKWRYAYTSPVACIEDQAALRISLSQALLTLSPRQRETVALHYLADLSHEDVAATLGISVNSVKKHLQRGLAALRRTIEEGRFVADAPTRTA